MPSDKLSIGEVASKLGVSISTLRRWDKEGVLKPFFVSPGLHRYYRDVDITLFSQDLFALAEKWALQALPSEPDVSFYCKLKPVFQSRLEQLEAALRKEPEFVDTYSLIVGIAAEIGNNSFDHNLGNWPDVAGIFFGYDIKKRKVALADRGRGVLTTLRSARPALVNDAEALKVAFTEIVTGRTPEKRGNGLKYVKNIVLTSPLAMQLAFRSGNAELLLEHGADKLRIESVSASVQGTIALLTF